MHSTVRSIQPLSDHLVNQIAAGEVIERPVSVVKELVENSIDAGASHIEVEIEEGGLSVITVTDDGSGLAGDEIHAALRRHWTSKISSIADLGVLQSLGFRGEALASIAAVATLDITTRRRTDSHGWRVTSTPGQPPSAPVPHQANVGMRISVRELFHNVPARKRFLKRARTETLHIQQLLRQLGFAQPAIALNLSQAGARQLRLPPAVTGTPSARWRALFGAAFMHAAVYVDASADGVRVEGWVGGPALATNQSDLQFLALNGRYIRDRHLAHAIRLAFADSVPAGKFPVYALAISIAPAAVDINVHPGKLEVRFVDVRAIHDLVYVAVRRALASPAPVLAAPATVTEDTVAYRAMPPPVAHTGPPGRAADLGTALALIANRYLLYRADGLIYGLDLRASWSAVIARRLRAHTARAETTKPLLIPQRLGAADALWTRLPRAELAALGFEIDDLGAAGCVLRGVPTVLPELATEVLVRQLPLEYAHGVALIDAVAQAAAAAIDLGAHGQPAQRALDALVRAAGATQFDLAAMAFALSGAALQQLDRAHD